MCKRCVDSQPRIRDVLEPKNSMVKASIRKVCSGRDQPQPPPDDMTKLPYDVSFSKFSNLSLSNESMIINKLLFS